MTIKHLTLLDVTTLWRNAAKLPRGHLRNVMFWECVEALRASGFVGDARAFLGRVAPWA